MKQKPEVSIRKKAMLAALEKSLGVVTTACKAIGISRETHYSWLEKDEKYKEAVNELDNIALDFAETKLHSNISKGSDTAIIFYLKTKGKKRGYIEKSEIDNTHRFGKFKISDVIKFKGSDFEDNG